MYEVEADGPEDNLAEYDQILTVTLHGIVVAAEVDVLKYPRSVFEKREDHEILHEVLADHTIKLVELDEPKPYEIEEDSTDFIARQTILFTGDVRLLTQRPTPYTSSPPVGYIVLPQYNQKGEIRTSIRVSSHQIDSDSVTKDRIENLFEENNKMIKKHVHHANENAESHNNGLTGYIENAIKIRRDRLEKTSLL